MSNRKKPTAASDLLQQNLLPDPVLPRVVQQNPGVVQQPMDMTGKSVIDVILDRLFSELKAMKTAYRQAFDNEQAELRVRKQFMLVMIESDVTTMELIEAGLAEARRQASPYFPDPGTFIDWCIQGRISLPSLQQAYAEACSHCHEYAEHEWSHPVVYVTLRNIGFNNFQIQSQENGRKIFKEEYQYICSQAARGHDFSAVMVQKNRIGYVDPDAPPPHDPSKPYHPNREKAAGIIGALKGLLNRPSQAKSYPIPEPVPFQRLVANTLSKWGCPVAEEDIPGEQDDWFWEVWNQRQHVIQFYIHRLKERQPEVTFFDLRTGMNGQEFIRLFERDKGR